MILVGTNKARADYVRKRREALDRPVDRPVAGDVLTVWRNDHARDVFNGTTFAVDAVDDGGDDHADAWFVRTTAGEYLHVYKDGSVTRTRWRT